MGASPFSPSFREFREFEGKAGWLGVRELPRFPSRICMVPFFFAYSNQLALFLFVLSPQPPLLPTEPCPHSQQLVHVRLPSFLGQRLGTRWKWKKQGLYFVMVFITFVLWVGERTKVGMWKSGRELAVAVLSCHVKGTLVLHSHLAWQCVPSTRIFPSQVHLHTFLPPSLALV